jgi:hypothetical protein
MLYEQVCQCLVYLKPNTKVPIFFHDFASEADICIFVVLALLFFAFHIFYRQLYIRASEEMQHQSEHLKYVGMQALGTTARVQTSQDTMSLGAKMMLLKMKVTATGASIVEEKKKMMKKKKDEIEMELGHNEESHAIASFGNVAVDRDLEMGGGAEVAAAATTGTDDKGSEKSQKSVGARSSTSSTRKSQGGNKKNG